MFSLVAQVDALGRLSRLPTPQPRTDVLKEGRQPDRIFQLLDEAGKPCTAAEISARTGINYNSVMCALRRLCNLDLVARVGKTRGTTKPQTLFASKE